MKTDLTFEFFNFALVFSESQQEVSWDVTFRLAQSPPRWHCQRVWPHPHRYVSWLFPDPRWVLMCDSPVAAMLENTVALAAVTILGVLEQGERERWEIIFKKSLIYFTFLEKIRNGIYALVLFVRLELQNVFFFMVLQTQTFWCFMFELHHFCGVWTWSCTMYCVGSTWEGRQCPQKWLKCVYVRARSLFLSAGDLRQEEVLRVSARHHRSAGVWAGLQGSVSHNSGSFHLSSIYFLMSHRIYFLLDINTNSDVLLLLLLYYLHSYVYFSFVKTLTFGVSRSNCSEYFPIFIVVLWTSGVFFSPGEQRWEWPTSPDDLVTVGVVCCRCVFALWVFLPLRSFVVLSRVLAVATATVGSDIITNDCV